MKQGIQTHFQRDNLRLYGCYFFALLRWSEIITGNQYSEADAIQLFELCRYKGWIDNECFVSDPVGILNFCIGEKKYREVIKAETPPQSRIYIVYQKKPGHGHFTLSHNGEIWDSLEPDRQGAKDYHIDSYRVMV